VRLAAKRAQRGGAFVPEGMMPELGSEDVSAQIDALFPPVEAGDAAPTFDLNSRIEQALDEREPELAALLSQTRHELAQDMIFWMDSMEQAPPPPSDLDDGPPEE